MNHRKVSKFAELLSKATLVFIGLCAVAPSVQAAESLATDFAFEKYKLSNGLEVILHQDQRTPTVTVNIWYHVGSKDEPAGKNGFAHLFEHLMFQGSKHVAEDTFFKHLERVGASDTNGTTSLDRTNYYETVPANQLETALWLESDRMGFLLDHVDQKTLDSQRDVVKNERRQNYENAPYGLVRQFIANALYPKEHPYHLLTIGTPEDLDAANLNDVQAFFRTFYVPNNATLCVAGDFEARRTKALIEKYFGSLASGPMPEVKKLPLPASLSGEVLQRVEAEVELPRLYLSWDTAPHFANGDAELDLLSNLLSAGKSSRLYKRLVYEMQIAQDVIAFQQSGLLSSIFQIVVTMKKGQTTQKALKIVDEELAKLRKTLVSKEEMERARMTQLSGLIFQMEKVSSRANELNVYNQNAGNPGHYATWIRHYESLTPADLQRVLKESLTQNKRIVTSVEPTAGAPRAGRLGRVGEAK